MPRHGPGLTGLSEYDLRKAIDAYHLALGSFVSRYADIEGVLHLTIQMFGGLSDEVGSALLSGVRADHLKDLLNRVLDATGHHDVKHNLERHLVQFSNITRIRNDILHYGARFESPDVLLVSNERDAHIQTRLRELRITPDDLHAMGVDLMTIHSGLILALETVSPSGGWMSRQFVQQTAEAAQQPWLYTQSQQVPLRDKRRKSPPPRTPRPPASQE